jgi:hypothetical protein
VRNEWLAILVGPRAQQPAITSPLYPGLLCSQVESEKDRSIPRPHTREAMRFGAKVNHQPNLQHYEGAITLVPAVWLTGQQVCWKGGL